MSDATLEHYSELATSVMHGENPILPKPHWGQDAAYIAFVIDGLWAANERFYNAAKKLKDHTPRTNANGLDKRFCHTCATFWPCKEWESAAVVIV